MMIPSLLGLLIWKEAPVAWRPYLIAATVLLLLAILVALVRYIRREHEVVENLPSRSEYRWPAAWSIARYSRALLTFLKIRGWRILAAEVSGEDRVLLCLQCDRHRLMLLCLRPGRSAGAEDLRYLEAGRRRQGTLESALVTDQPLRQEPEAGAVAPRRLSYDQLENLAESLEGGPEEARRAAEMRAAEQAAEQAELAAC